MYPTISMSDFEQIGQEYVNIIDVRRQALYDKGHIVNATNIPFSELEVQCTGLSFDTTYYVVCQQGVTSHKASALLTQKGFKVINVADGMSQWTKELVQA